MRTIAATHHRPTTLLCSSVPFPSVCFPPQFKTSSLAPYYPVQHPVFFSFRLLFDRLSALRTHTYAHSHARPPLEVGDEEQCAVCDESGPLVLTYPVLHLARAIHHVYKYICICVFNLFAAGLVRLTIDLHWPPYVEWHSMSFRPRRPQPMFNLCQTVFFPRVACQAQCRGRHLSLSFMFSLCGGRATSSKLLGPPFSEALFFLSPLTFLCPAVQLPTLLLSAIILIMALHTKKKV